MTDTPTLPNLEGLSIGGRLISPEDTPDQVVPVVDMAFDTGQTFSMLSPQAAMVATQILLAAEQMRQQSILVETLTDLGYDDERIGLIVTTMIGKTAGAEQAQQAGQRLDVIRGPVDTDALRKGPENIGS